MLKAVLRNCALFTFSMVVASSFAAKICIDPGHGGSDSGATSTAGGYEKTNALNTGLKFRDWLNADTNDGGGGGSWNVIMTRTTDVSVSLSARVDYANSNGANRFMSIHNNAFNSAANGTETFSYTSGSSYSHDLRNKVQYRMLNAWGLLNRGNKTANFYVIKYTNMPAELAELGFIDAYPDYNYVDVSSHQDTAARGHLYAIQTHYGLAAYTPGTGAKNYIKDNNQSGFSVSGNWATGTSAADKYGADYRYRSTAAVSDPASWTISVSPGGNHDISAWWSAGTNRAPSAPYILPSGATVNVNQQANGGKWNYLGTNNISGSATTKLSCWTTSGYVVIADAIKYYGPK